MDPIEKKPLYHFYPGSYVLSTAPNSCNLRCPFCQNDGISQRESPTKYISSQELVDIALQQNSIGIAYTYTEPFTWYEYLLDTAALAHKYSLKNVLVTNGMINVGPLKKLLPLIDSANIDLKSMAPDFYNDIIFGDLDTVLNTIRITKKHWHIEITNLIIPGYNDSVELLSALIEFVASIGIGTPLHFSRYFPHYKFTSQVCGATPIETLKFAQKLAKEKLYYVYLGNVWEDDSNTYCPECNNLLIGRSGYNVNIIGIDECKCAKCGKEADFVI
jgi:pyruvate formate lyase activating enzyme